MSYKLTLKSWIKLKRKYIFKIYIKVTGKQIFKTKDDIVTDKITEKERLIYEDVIQVKYCVGKRCIKFSVQRFILI